MCVANAIILYNSNYVFLHFYSVPRGIKVVKTCSNISFTMHDGDNRSLDVGLRQRSLWAFLKLYKGPWGAVVSAGMLRCTNMDGYQCHSFAIILFSCFTLYCVLGYREGLVLTYLSYCLMMVKGYRLFNLEI